MVKSLKCAIFFALVLTSYLGVAQSIFENPIDGTNPNTANPYTANQTHDPNITVSGIGRGPGISGVGIDDTYSANGWPGLFLGSTDYFEFTLTPNAGYKIDFSSFIFTAESTLLIGPNSINVRTSLNFANNIAGSLTTLSLGSPTEYSINLSATAYQNITTPITFRIYGFLAAGGTFSIHDFTFNGLVSCANTTTWSGSAWSNGLPSISTHAIIAGNYNTATGGNQTSFRACSLTVNTGSTLIIDNNTYVEVENNIVTNGDLTVETQGNLKQNNKSSTMTGTGTTRVNKQTPLKNVWYHYTYWSSPVKGQTIASAFPEAPSSRRFWFNAANYVDLEGDNIDDDDNDWTVASGNMQPGVGYAVTESRSHIPGSFGEATFIGEFNTGDIPTGIHSNTLNTGGSWNLIGNPYPCAIDFNAFYTENSSVIGGAAYFWSQSLPPLSSNPGNQALNFNQDDYAIYAAGSEGGIAGANGIIPTQYIPSAQGFFIAGLRNDEVTFTNAMRMADETSNSQFFKNSDSKNNMEQNKLWINLTSDNGIFNQILTAYVDGATNGDDGMAYDAPRMLTPQISTTLYSTIKNSTKKFAIQGKAANSLNTNETIPLGFATNIKVETLFTLSIAQLQGDFLNNNSIYLKDNVLSKVHNLSESDYTFTSEVGEFNDRFVVMFNNQSLSNEASELDANTLTIIDLNNHVKFTASNNLTIKKVAIFDLLGRELYQFEGRNNSEVYKLSNLKHTIYIAKVELSNGAIITQKAIKK